MTRRLLLLSSLALAGASGVMGSRALAAPSAAYPAARAGSGGSVLVLGRRGGVSSRVDPYLSPAPAMNEPVGRARRPRARVAGDAGVTVPQVLEKLRRQGSIDDATAQNDDSLWQAALRAERRLSGTRYAELAAVTVNVHALAAGGLLTPSRLPEVFLTVARNLDWWTHGSLPANGQRIEFAGSGLVWQYYAGQGLELQVLGSFGRADGLYTAGPSHTGEMRALVDEMIPLAARRAGVLAWEYLFHFDGGQPPWTSAMSQATGIEALTRAARASRAQGDAAGAQHYLDVAHAALPILAMAPPAGVSVATPRGRRFLLYSFAPGAAVINGFLQTLIGLTDYARASGDPLAGRLFTQGLAEAEAELPSYDTGAWSLYQPGEEDSLDYHVLVTGFLHALCRRTGAPVLCGTAQNFDRYLRTPPVLKLGTTQVVQGTRAALRFTLSKASHVGVVVLRGARVLFSTSADFPYGDNAFALPGLPSAGSYTVHLAGTDLAGNFARTVWSLSVRPRPRPHRRPAPRRGRHRSAPRARAAR